MAAGLAVGAAAQTKSPESQVRATYNRVTFLSDLTVIQELLYASLPKTVPDSIRVIDQKVAKGEITFSLGSMSSGPISDIRDKLWVSEITPRTNLGSVLDISSSLFNLNYKGTTALGEGTQAEWASPNVTNLELVGTGMSKTVGWVVDNASQDFAAPDAVYTSYVAYTVTSTYMGRVNGPYKALALFGKDAKGRPVFTIQDPGVGGAGIANVKTTHDYPFTLVLTNARESAGLSQWMAEHMVNQAECPHTGRDLCCTDSGCGLPSDDVRADLQKPVVQ